MHKTITIKGRKIILGISAIRYRGKTTKIEPRLLKLLIMLYERRGNVVLKEEIMNHVWKDTIVTDDSLTKAISKLREVLDDSGKMKTIKTVRGVGYTLHTRSAIANLRIRPHLVILYSAIFLILYVVLGSGLVQWAFGASRTSG